MTTFDLSPLYRTAIGFDRMANMLSNASRSDTNGYPPYNIEAFGEDNYRITMAVAGFSEEDLDITTEQNTLTVAGNKSETEETAENREFLYRGIANRSFERRFQLADHVKVTGASIRNGLLHIDLEREIPEQMKPRKVEIKSEKLIDSSRTDKEKAA